MYIQLLIIGMYSIYHYPKSSMILNNLVIHNEKRIYCDNAKQNNTTKALNTSTQIELPRKRFWLVGLKKYLLRIDQTWTNSCFEAKKDNNWFVWITHQKRKKSFDARKWFFFFYIIMDVFFNDLIKVLWTVLWKKLKTICIDFIKLN